MAVNSRKHGLQEPRWSNHFSASERGIRCEAIPSRNAVPGQPTRPGLGNSDDSPLERTSSICSSAFFDCSWFVRYRFSAPTKAAQLRFEPSAFEPAAKYRKLVPELHFSVLLGTAERSRDFPPRVAILV